SAVSFCLLASRLMLNKAITRITQTKTRTTIPIRFFIDKQDGSDARIWQAPIPGWTPGFFLGEGRIVPHPNAPVLGRSNGEKLELVRKSVCVPIFGRWLRPT